MELSEFLTKKSLFLDRQRKTIHNTVSMETPNENPTTTSVNAPEKKSAPTRSRLKVMTSIVDDFKALSPNDRLWVMNELTEIVTAALPEDVKG